MKNISLVLRYYYGESHSKRKIAGNIPRYCAQLYTEESGAGGDHLASARWHAEEKLEALLFPNNDSEGIRPQPDCKVVREKFCQPGVSRERVWR